MLSFLLIRIGDPADPGDSLRTGNGGFTYRMLIERIGGTCGIYEMAANGKGGVSVYELSPMGKPMKVTLADFNRAKGGGVYLIDCGGKVYVCGAGTGEAGVAFARRLLGK